MLKYKLIYSYSCVFFVLTCLEDGTLGIARWSCCESASYWATCLLRETKGKPLYGHVILKYVTSGTRSEYCKFINVSTNPCCELVRIKQVIHAIISEWDPFIVCKVYFHSLAIIMLTNPDCVFFFFFFFFLCVT